MLDIEYELEFYTPILSRGLTNDVKEAYKRKRYESLANGKMKIHRFNIFSENGSALKRAIRYFFCGIQHLYYGAKTKDADVMFISSTPPFQGAIAALVKKNQPYANCIQSTRYISRFFNRNWLNKERQFVMGNWAYY